MKKMTTLCLALALTCATEAGATTDKQPKLKGRQTVAWGVAVPGSRTQSASAMRFLNMGLGAPMAAPRAVGNDPVSSVTTPGFGWADGPDGNQWYYTQNYKLDGYFYSGSTITLYDNNNQQVGQFDIDVPDTLQVNSIEMYSALTKKMFDRDDTSIEAMVSIHAVGNAENNYKDSYITRAYHIDGSGIAYECEGSGMLFDASKGWNTYQRLILPIEKVIDGKEYVSIDFIAPPTWGKDEPYVEHTLDIPFENINYMDGAYINCFVIEDKPYYVVAQYDTAYCTMPEDYTQDIIVTPNNHFVLKTYDRNYSLVDSVAVPIEESPKGIYRMAAFGRMSDNDLSKGYFGPEDQFSYVVTWVDYHLQSDENTYNFDLYDNNTQDYDLNFYELPFVKFAKGGNGSKENPYLISTVGDLSYMAAAPDSAYRLAADIDMNDYNYDWTPVPTFNGSFDGAHHAIVNLSITTNDAHAGLFGMLGEDVEVKDLVFARPTIQVTDDNQFVGVLAGESTQDSISNVHVFDGLIVGESDATIGGIVGGSFLYTNFNDCSFQGNINTPEASPVGGIVGRTATSTKITACASNAEITGNSSVGGIAGSFSANDTINDCHVTGKLVAANTIGGIVGESSRGVIDRCVFNGSVMATEANWSGLSAGGIVGSLAADWSQQTTPVISHCVSTGTVNAEEPDETVHAIAGWTIANEYYEDGETPLEEKGLASNYSTAAPEGSADSSLDGAPVKVADLNDDFFKQMGYAFGQDTKAPWKSADTTPVLYFENTALVLTLSDNAVLLDNDADCYITATVYGQSADDITAVSDNSNVADVDIESREDGVATLHITSYKDGVANINVTVGTLTMACTVTVDHTLTTVKPLDKGQKLTILVTGNTISAPGATAITAYTLDGQVAAQSASTISALAKGLYIVKATDATGRQTAAKVMVK